MNSTSLGRLSILTLREVIVRKRTLGLKREDQKVHNITCYTTAVAHDPQRLDMHPRDERAVAQVFRHVDALLTVVPASASAAAFGVYLTPHERRVFVFLRRKKRFVCKLLAL